MGSQGECSPTQVAKHLRLMFKKSFGSVRQFRSFGPPSPNREADMLFSGWLIHVVVLGAIAALAAITVMH